MDLFDTHSDPHLEKQRRWLIGCVPGGYPNSRARITSSPRTVSWPGPIQDDRVFSMILWGPPGCGKTTLANIIANETKCEFVRISAVLSGVKEVRQIIDTARESGPCSKTDSAVRG